MRFPNGRLYGFFPLYEIRRYWLADLTIELPGDGGLPFMGGHGVCLYK
jgi:hypothetical protein